MVQGVGVVGEADGEKQLSSLHGGVGGGVGIPAVGLQCVAEAAVFTCFPVFTSIAQAKGAKKGKITEKILEIMVYKFARCVL